MPVGYCKIFGVLGSANYLVDSFPSYKGKAHFEKNELLKSGLYYFILPEQNGFFQFLLDKDQQMAMNTDTSDLIGRMKINGSEDNLLFYENLQYESSFHKKIDSVMSDLKTFEADQSKVLLLEANKDKILKDRKSYLEGLSKNHRASSARGYG